MCKVLRSWWRDKYIYRSRTVSMKNQVYACPWSRVQRSPEWQYHWPWSDAMIHKVRAWESQILRLTHRARRIDFVGHPGFVLQNQNIKVHDGLLEEDEPAAADGGNCKTIWTTMTWAENDGDVPIMLALRSILGWRTTAWW